MGDTVNNTWIIGDTHFYDENIIVYERKKLNYSPIKFSTVKEEILKSHTK